MCSLACRSFVLDPPHQGRMLLYIHIGRWPLWNPLIPPHEHSTFKRSVALHLIPNNRNDAVNNTRRNGIPYNMGKVIHIKIASRDALFSAITNLVVCLVIHNRENASVLLKPWVLSGPCLYAKGDISSPEETWTNATASQTGNQW